jgi:hypothetical protein
MGLSKEYSAAEGGKSLFMALCAESCFDIHVIFTISLREIVKMSNYLAPEGCDIHSRSGADIAKFLENIELMLTTGTDETLYSGVTVSPLGSSKTSGNFLFSFDMPDVALCLIITKRDSIDFPNNGSPVRGMIWAENNGHGISRVP